jgi:hypothetical protein
MPITYTLDDAKGLILTRVTGMLTVEDTLAYFERLSHDPACPDAAIEIVDFTGVSDFVLHYTEMREITEKYQDAKVGRQILATIFHCTSDLAYGIARQLQAFHELTNAEHVARITRSQAELDQCIAGLRSRRAMKTD